MDRCRIKGSCSPSRGQGTHAIPVRALLGPWKRILRGAGVLVFLGVTGVLVHFYLRLTPMIDARLANVFENPSLIIAAPTELQVGQHLTAAAVAAHLRRVRYTVGQESRGIGSYIAKDNWMEIQPGPESLLRDGQTLYGPARLEFNGDRLVSITALSTRTPLSTYILEPEVITSLFGESRMKRRWVRHEDLPKVVVDALLAAEDHRFYSHFGVDCLRIIGAAIANLRANKRLQGGSTLTMQLARNLFLTPTRTIRRKMTEVFLALLIELRLPKNRILELYANQVYLGQRNSFSIHGFGAAAITYFGKDVSDLTLPEAALLVGMIHGPNLYLSYEHPERAAERRNLVLQRMLRRGFITATEAELASKSPLGVTELSADARQVPYFVDMVKAQLLARFSEHDLVSGGYRIYTTLDPDLQRAASHAARVSLIEVDREVRKQREPESPMDSTLPELALVALDPHTGDVKALVGGRSYGASQLNHVLARRQPGSSFKPFLYAAALNSGVDGSQPLITPTTVLVDEPTSFESGGEPYEPKNYMQAYRGSVTVREALTYSLNVPAVRLAEMVGYHKVRNFAVTAGFNHELRPTPAIALGAYVATPLEIAGAYTIFANGGKYVGPRCIVAVTDAKGRPVWNNPIAPRRVLDARVSYLMVSLLQSAIDRGTGAGVRVRGFPLPAAGKTGTSHDGWFAGFTPNLLAVAWVGYDDGRDLDIPGATSGLPVWTEFMKRAASLSPYRDPQPFNEPPGIARAEIDIHTNLVALTDSTTTRTEVFIAGTEPLPSVEHEQTEGALGAPAQEPSEHPSDRSIQPRGLHAILTKLRGMGQQITFGSDGSFLRDEAGATDGDAGQSSTKTGAAAKTVVSFPLGTDVALESLR